MVIENFAVKFAFQHKIRALVLGSLDLISETIEGSTAM